MHSRRSRSVPALLTAVAALAALALLVAACGTNADEGSAGGSGGDPGGPLTLAIAYTSEVDPDVFFDLELMSVTNAVYEGLVRYVPGGTDIEGVLAEDWTVSEDGLTYTFTLRDDINFADGSPIDSAAVQAAFERKAAVAGPPSYILAEVDHYETPDEITFVVVLAQPVNNFMQRMASPAGSLITNPAVVAEHTVDDDLAQGWLGTNSAGSGPYVIGEFVPDDRVVLVPNENYWGEAPPFSEVVLRVVPDIASQQLQVEQGDVDLIHDVSPETAAQIESQGDLAVDAVYGITQAFVQVNVTKPPFDDPAAARAFAASIDRDQIVSEVFGEYGKVADQTAPEGVIPEGLATFEPDYDPDAFAEATADLPKDQPVTLAGISPDPRNLSARVNDYLATILRDAGYDAQIVEVQSADYFGFIGVPDQAPTLTFSVQPGDGAAPANWFDLFMTTYGALNVGGIGSPEADALMVQGNSVPAPADPDFQSYSDASDLIVEQGGWIPIADTPTIFVHPEDLTNVQMHMTVSPAVWVQDLRRG
jgi:peptide/nickel transport system substrate-binding protein